MRFMIFHIVQRIELTAIVLALAAALGLVVAVLLTGRWTNSEAALTPATRTVTAATPTVVRTVTTHETVTVVTQAGQEVPPDGQPPELRYLVKPGDTLWDIAAANYDDIGGGMRTIRLRNGLKRQKVLAGEVLVIPLEGGGDPR